MDFRTAVYMAVALAYVGYPLYLMMTRPDGARLRVWGLGLMVYGALGLFWPDGGNVAALGGGLLAVAGFGLYFGVLISRLPWLALMAYCLGVIASPDVHDPIWLLLGAIVLALAFERCMSGVVIHQPDKESA